jgi:hypothetical protein
MKILCFVVVCFFIASVAGASEKVLLPKKGVELNDSEYINQRDQKILSYLRINLCGALAIGLYQNPYDIANVVAVGGIMATSWRLAQLRAEIENNQKILKNKLTA